MGRPAIPVDQRIESSIQRLTETGCWVWTLHTNNHGYGEMKLGGKTTMAHRSVYEALVGKIPDGLTLDHLCKVRCCVNPAHLEPVTAEENSKRGDRANKGLYNRIKTSCPKGHNYNDENTVFSFKSTGGYRRHCKTCRSEQRVERSAS